jgi:hypothetical protein
VCAFKAKSNSAFSPLPSAEAVRLRRRLSFPEQLSALQSYLPSCSALEPPERQEPFVNQTLVYQALAMLARLFRYGDSLSWDVRHRPL